MDILEKIQRSWALHNVVTDAHQPHDNQAGAVVHRQRSVLADNTGYHPSIANGFLGEVWANERVSGGGVR